MAIPRLVVHDDCGQLLLVFENENGQWFKTPSFMSTNVKVCPTCKRTLLLAETVQANMAEAIGRETECSKQC